MPSLGQLSQMKFFIFSLGTFKMRLNKIKKKISKTIDVKDMLKVVFLSMKLFEDFLVSKKYF